MADEVYTSAGTKLSVSETLAAEYDASGYEAVTGWEEVGEVTNIDQFGRNYEQVPHQPLSTRGTKIRKGSFEEGQPTITMARVPGTDDGQAILRDMADSDDNISVKIEYANGDVTYATALVMNYSSDIGSINQITQAQAVLALQPGTVIDVDND